MHRIVLFVLGAAALGALAVAWLEFAPARNDALPVAAPGFSISEYDRTVGNPKAPVVLIEYGAPVCPHCAQFDMEDFPELKTSYIDTGKVFYVFRVYPVRPGDGPAERLLRCLPREKYFSFLDLLFRNQPQWDGDEYPVADSHAGLIRMARIAGMGAEQAEACMQDDSTNDAINQIAQDGQKRYGLTGTPTFVVDGVPAAAGEHWPQLRSRLNTALAAKGARVP